jgi:hypothetical protein
MMNRDAKKSGLTNSSASVERLIASASCGRHCSPTTLSSSLHTSTPRSRTTGASITTNRFRHFTSGRL